MLRGRGIGSFGWPGIDGTATVVPPIIQPKQPSRMVQIMLCPMSGMIDPYADSLSFGSNLFLGDISLLNHIEGVSHSSMKSVLVAPKSRMDNLRLN
jgi:hypothetical protein